MFMGESENGRIGEWENGGTEDSRRESGRRETGNVITEER
jgi:hypothetical protein